MEQILNPFLFIGNFSDSGNVLVSFKPLQLRKKENGFAKEKSFAFKFLYNITVQLRITKSYMTIKTHTVKIKKSGNIV